ALPSPGDERELGILVSRLHGHHVDLHRPPWELHFIEGLERGRFAWYVKVHHSLVDGYSAMQALMNGLTPDADERDRPLFFSIPQRSRKPEPAPPGEHSETPGGGGGIHYPELLAAVRAQYGASKTVLRALLNVIRASRAGDHELVSPLEAPRCV